MDDERGCGDCIVKSWGSSPLSLIILLHGLGDDANSLMFLGEKLYSTQHGSKVISLNAPYKSIAYFSGEEIRSWFDLKLSWDEGIGDAAGLMDSCRRVLDTIEIGIREGFSEKNIFLGGFSQGGMVSLISSTMMKRQIGGIFALSSVLRDIDFISGDILQNKIQVPVFFAEATKDEIIPEEVRSATKDFVERMFSGYLTYRKYDIGHNLVKEEVDDLRAWIHEKIKLP
ncbi:alpha/beta hydrolase [Candidatus Ichthyocystis hellenicum]|uniref:alpha/beta hydrolase n=1 Tax=Candidatus Ichthyocystis hellenicum TaxID=1561003 RepID=UPI000B86CA25|nr:hypothetical protein [Candidatus Ichthyocystis hellenicum]